MFLFGSSGYFLRSVDGDGGDASFGTVHVDLVTTSADGGVSVDEGRGAHAHRAPASVGLTLPGSALRSGAGRVGTAVLPVRDAEERVLGLGLDAVNRLDRVRDVGKVDK